MHPKSLLVALAALSLSAPAAQEQPRAPRPDLEGVVVDEQGEPLEGASVFVYTATPRRGSSPY